VHFAITSSALSTSYRPIAPVGAFDKPEKDLLLLLKPRLRCNERILQSAVDPPLRSI